MCLFSIYNAFDFILGQLLSDYCHFPRSARQRHTTQLVRLKEEKLWILMPNWENFSSGKLRELILKPLLLIPGHRGVNSIYLIWWNICWRFLKDKRLIKDFWWSATIKTCSESCRNLGTCDVGEDSNEILNVDVLLACSKMYNKV